MILQKKNIKKKKKFFLKKNGEIIFEGIEMPSCMMQVNYCTCTGDYPVQTYTNVHTH